MSLAAPMGAADHDREPPARSDRLDADLKALVHRRLLASDGTACADLGRAGIDDRLGSLLGDAAPLLAPAHRRRLVDELVAEVLGLGPLEPHLADPDVTEVMVNGPGRAYVERRGRIEPICLDLDADAIRRLVDRVVGPLGLRFDRAAPVVDARLPDGSRLHAVLPPLALDGPCVTIRRFACHDLSIDAFSPGPLAAAFLAGAVVGGANVLVAGGTSAGKTSLLNALSALIPAHERVVTVEETAELRLRGAHVVRLEARRANAEDAGEVTVRDLVRAALRMRPDRIVVGEVRGGEAFDMLQAVNTGHDGSLTTIHANGVVEALHRLETLVLLAGVAIPSEAVRAQIGLTIDLVVQVARGEGGRRTVEAIAEVERTGAAAGANGLGCRLLFGRDGAAVPGDPLVRVAEAERPRLARVGAR